MSTLTFFKHVLRQAIFLMAILLGLAVAFLSAAIEYSVISGILNSVVGNMPISAKYMPLLIVMSLEGSKIYLYILIQVGKSVKDTDLITKNTGVLLKCLIAFSLVCTMIWSTNVLYGGIIGDTSYDVAMEELDANFDREIQSLQNIKDVQISDSVKDFQAIYETAKEQYDSYEIILTPQYMYNRSNAEKLRLYDVMMSTHADLEEAKAQATYKVEQSQAAAINEIENQRSMARLELQTKAAIEHAGANQYLHVFLTAVSQNLLQLTSYSSGTYFMATLIFAVVLSFVLEALISADLRMIAVNDNMLVEILETGKIPEALRLRLQKIVQAILVSMVSLLIFIFFNLWRELDVYSENIEVAMIVFLSVEVLVGFAYLGRTNEKPDSEKDERPNKLGNIWSTLTLCVTKGCVAFVGYILLGAMFGSSFQELTLPAVGMSLGSIGGHLIHFPTATTL